MKKYRILSIGDTANIISILNKFLKEFSIDIIRFRGKNAEIVESGNRIYFNSDKTLEQVRELERIKSNYNLFIVTGWSGARLAYIAGLNFIWIFTGDDIRHPIFIKDGINDCNFFERLFYRQVFCDVSAYLALIEDTLVDLKRYTDKGILIGAAVDITKFNPDVKPIVLPKKEFTFLSPQRISYEKGTNIIWDAITKCKNKFKVLQVEWYDDFLPETRVKNKELTRNIPQNVELIPMIKYDEIASYYVAVDAILGQISIGWPGSIEREAAFCKKPVLTYINPDYKIVIDNKLVSPPFLPTTKDPVELSRIIDEIIISEKFRKELAEAEYEFVKKTSDPHTIAEKYEDVFKRVLRENNKKKTSSNIRKLFFVLSYYTNLKRLFKKFRL